MRSRQFQALTELLHSFNTSLAQLVSIQKARLQLEKANMTIDDSVVQQLVDALNTAVLSETGEATLNASLQAQLAPNPTLLASVQTALANAAAATPPATPVVTPPAPTPAPTPAP